MRNFASLGIHFLALCSALATLHCSSGSNSQQAPPGAEGGPPDSGVDSATGGSDSGAVSRDAAGEPSEEASADEDAGADSGGGTDSGAGAEAATGADAEGGAEADGGGCAPCPPQYTCVITPGGVQQTLADTQEPDGTCLLGAAKLYCGGTGLAADGSPLTWAAGNGFGPSGGPGIVVQSTKGLQLNCE